MAKLARDVMTPDPACCTSNMTLDQVAKLMVQNDCGEIPVIDAADQPIGVITDRDIVCRVVAEGKNPIAHTAEQYMSQPVVSVRADAHARRRRRRAAAERACLESAFREAARFGSRFSARDVARERLGDGLRRVRR